MATSRTCVADAKTQKQELEDTKVTALRQIQEVIRQSDQTIKSVCTGLPWRGGWSTYLSGARTASTHLPPVRRPPSPIIR